MIHTIQIQSKQQIKPLHIHMRYLELNYLHFF